MSDEEIQRIAHRILRALTPEIEIVVNASVRKAIRDAAKSMGCNLDELTA